MKVQKEAIPSNVATSTNIVQDGFRLLRVHRALRASFPSLIIHQIMPSWTV